jgi:hypothetical protein
MDKCYPSILLQPYGWEANKPKSYSVPEQFIEFVGKVLDNPDGEVT